MSKHYRGTPKVTITIEGILRVDGKPFQDMQARPYIAVKGVTYLLFPRSKRIREFFFKGEWLTVTGVFNATWQDNGNTLIGVTITDASATLGENSIPDLPSVARGL